MSRPDPPPGAPTTADLVRGALDEAIASVEAAGHPLVALDAGCGRVSALAPFRGRIDRLVGIDIHPPAPGSLPHVDTFITADLCVDREAVDPATVDLVLSSFTLEHFTDPPAALVNLRSWLRPGGRIVLVTVNRRHPFVAAYLGLPGPLRGRLQRLVKETAADAHPLVGACNTPDAIRGALVRAGFIDVRLSTVGHLARAWGRRGWTRALGRWGDRLAAGRPSRRSTIVATAAAP